jgi:hypothetical protein
MGIKSTKDVSRSELEEMYVEKTIQLDKDHRKRLFKSQAVLMTDRDLENAVERLNDEVNDGEGFENYCIIDKE